MNSSTPYGKSEFTYDKSEFIDYMIIRWHDLPEDDPKSSLSLVEYLKVTEEEYSRFFLYSDELEALVRARQPEEALKFDQSFTQ